MQIFAAVSRGTYGLAFCAVCSLSQRPYEDLAVDRLEVVIRASACKDQEPLSFGLSHEAQQHIVHAKVALLLFAYH